jgi:hypothetical protein
MQPCYVWIAEKIFENVVTEIRTTRSAGGLLQPYKGLVLAALGGVLNYGQRNSYLCDSQTSFQRSNFEDLFGDG